MMNVVGRGGGGVGGAPGGWAGGWAGVNKLTIGFRSISPKPFEMFE